MKSAFARASEHKARKCAHTVFIANPSLARAIDRLCFTGLCPGQLCGAGARIEGPDRGQRRHIRYDISDFQHRCHGSDVDCVGHGSMAAGSGESGCDRPDGSDLVVARNDLSGPGFGRGNIPVGGGVGCHGCPDECSRVRNQVANRPIINEPKPRNLFLRLCEGGLVDRNSVRGGLYRWLCLAWCLSPS